MLIKQGSIVHHDTDDYDYLVVSNEHYQMYFKTIIAVPVSHDTRYQQAAYQESPLFITIATDQGCVVGLLQYLVTLPVAECRLTNIPSLDEHQRQQIRNCIHSFF